MEPSKGFVPEREEFEHLRDGKGSFHILLWSLQALPKRLGLKRLCPQSHSNKFRRIFGPLSKETEAWHLTGLPFCLWSEMTGLAWDTSGWGQTKPGIVRTHLRDQVGAHFYTLSKPKHRVSNSPTQAWTGKQDPVSNLSPWAECPQAAESHGKSFMASPIKWEEWPNLVGLLWQLNGVNCGKCLSVALTTHNVCYC